jgi:hypothetical protein
MKEVAAKKLVSVPARRRQVAYGRERGLSARRACTLFSVASRALARRSILYNSESAQAGTCGSSG